VAPGSPLTAGAPPQPGASASRRPEPARLASKGRASCSITSNLQREVTPAGMESPRSPAATAPDRFRPGPVFRARQDFVRTPGRRRRRAQGAVSASRKTGGGIPQGRPAGSADPSATGSGAAGTVCDRGIRPSIHDIFRAAHSIRYSMRHGPIVPLITPEPHEN